MAVLFNLIADLTGGIRVTVLEREVVARDDARWSGQAQAPPDDRDSPAGHAAPDCPRRRLG